MGFRLVRLAVLLIAVAGSLAACIVVPASYPPRVYAPAPPPVVYGPPPAPPPCRWVWVGRWECR
jgi:hypothetical protein